MRWAISTSTLWTLAIFGVSGSIAARVQAQAGSPASPQEIVQLFCQADASGKRLTQQSAWEVQPFLAEQNAWVTPNEITIIKDYVVLHVPEIPGGPGQVTVDYNVWGRLELSSLSFIPIGGQFQNQPTPIREYFELSRSSGNSQPMGSAQWKISKMPPEPHIGLEAAIRYVKQSALISRSTALRANAQRTLAELQKLYQLQAWSRGAPPSFQQTAPAVLAQFAAMETEGRALIPDGMKEFDALFVRSPEWRPGTIHVVKSYSIEDVPFVGRRGNIYVDYLPVGDLDQSIRFTSKSSPDTKVRQAYTLVLQAAPALPLRSEIASPLPAGPPTWKIESSNLEQWITVNAAIRYVTATRDASSDPAVKMNADATLAILRSIASSPHF